MMLDQILELYGLNTNNYHIKSFGTGLINHTWKVSGPENYILQRINPYVFKNPEAIAENMALLAEYLKHTAPNYLFVAPIPTLKGERMAEINHKEYYRLFPFIDNSVTITEITNQQEAFEAAQQFGKFTYLLRDFKLEKLHYTLPQFHDLKLRFDQFKEACSTAGADKLAIAATAINDIYKYQGILFTYMQLIDHQQLPLRVIHHDTKISNVLFDQHHNGLCVIDLDTVMPGYFLSDVGDMLRTYLSPANEEERDFSKIQINEECFYAIYKGYVSAMGTALTPAEKEYFTYSGQYMIYMQVLRFLTDFLNDDIYYHTTYPLQNLVRAQNQLKLLEQFTRSENRFKKFIEYFSFKHDNIVN
ncbi:phosphotransferase enzyme family protein [Mucilaginibacter lappiensis]|uniref:Ser/Thr protein kinase RdoA (MazF antagonist) n=1 Tax=Mucilaginibacter lappiensis TaxID=354630 RepID=A0A841JEM8_9SPHI|nr:aminoglycoside phosphotransferase family protein [Mucilaginibacter lappiensis]MBB6126541.1 Ser/Thr protein kinase RdoA (MazF antagonist) [Mucilaginibacter lappiensis]